MQGAATDQGGAGAGPPGTGYGTPRQRPDRMAELQYGRIPELEKQLAAAQAEASQTRDAAAAQQGHRGGDRRGGLQVDRHSGVQDAGGRDARSCCAWRRRCSKRVVGQDEAVTVVSNAIRRSRAGLADPQPAERLVPVPRPDRRGQDRAVQGAGRVPVRHRGGDGAHRHVRVHGEALRGAPDRRAAGLCRLRGGRLPDRGRAPQARTR